MQPSARTRACLFAANVLSGAAPGVAIAQSFPIEPIRVVIPFQPGNTLDVMAHLTAGKLEEARLFLIGSTPEQFSAMYQAGFEICADAVKTAGLKPE